MSVQVDSSMMQNLRTENTTYLVIQLNQSNVTEYLTDDDDAPFYDFVHGLYLYAIPLISVLGIIGNVCSFKVFMFSSFSKHPSSIYLSVLSISDTWFLMALFLGWLGSLELPFMMDSIGMCMVLVYITYITSFLSVWYVVLIMFDRYIVVCHPLKSPKLCSRKRSIVATISITAFGLLFYVHSFFTTEIITSPTGKGTVCSMNDDNIMFVTMITYIDTAITFIVPFLAIFVLNILVIRAIRSFTYRHISRHEKKYFSPPYNTLSLAQMRLTVMLMVVSIVFLVLNLPSYGVRFYIAVNNLVRVKNIPLFLAQQICQILYYTNFSINFLLYACTSKTFRRCLTECQRLVRH